MTELCKGVPCATPHARATTPRFGDYAREDTADTTSRRGLIAGRVTALVADPFPVLVEGSHRAEFLGDEVYDASTGPGPLGRVVL